MGMGYFEGFARHLNETFSVSLGETSVEMTLIEATKGKPRDWAGMRKEPFSLIFKCGKPVVLPQRTYPFQNDGFGKMDIFITPIGKAPDGVLYQAIFN